MFAFDFNEHIWSVLGKDIIIDDNNCSKEQKRQRRDIDVMMMRWKNLPYIVNEEMNHK